jgi:nicotinate phosphoribosyltransferase
MIKSLLDLDLYKLTVQQIAFHRFNNLDTEYRFLCRNNDKVQLTEYITLEELREELNALGDISLTDAEYDYLDGQDFVQGDYLEYLRTFRLNPKKFLTVDQVGDAFNIVAKGPWCAVILFETMVLSVVNELYARNYARAHGTSIDSLTTISIERMQQKIKLLNSADTIPKIIEFGTRRRWSSAWQNRAITMLKDGLVNNNLAGTSNVKMAMEHNIAPIGTYGHEMLMAMQGIYPFQHAQREAFKIWLREYRGKWGIALTDTLGDAKFLTDYTFELAKGYDGVRHDSGDPMEFAHMIKKMYKGYNIDPSTKRVVFSDGLNIPKALDLEGQLEATFQTSYGIGTNLTNDNGQPVPQIVMKMYKSHGQYVAKLSNNPAKSCCGSPVALDYFRLITDEFTD